jgi:hypothetical protein
MAVETANIAACVGGLGKMGLLMTFAMTAQTAGAGLLPRFPLEHEYLGFVAAASYVVGTGTMATLATLLRGATLFVQRGLPVRRFLPGVVDFLVTGLAGLRSHVLGGVGGRSTDRRCAGGLSAFGGNLRAGLARSKGNQEKKQDEKGKNS